MRRFLKVPAVFAALLIVLTDSSAHATQIACHEAHCSAGMSLHPTCRTCGTAESRAPRWSRGNTTHDDWPANMILG
jgi:hypothetical protein